MSEWNKQDTKRSENPISFLHSSSSFFLALKVSRSWTKERGSKKKSGIKHERNKQRMKERLLLFSGSFIDRLQRRWIQKTRRNITSKSIFHFHYIFCSLQFSFRKSLEQTKKPQSHICLCFLFSFSLSVILFYTFAVELNCIGYRNPSLSFSPPPPQNPHFGGRLRSICHWEMQRYHGTAWANKNLCMCKKS